MYVYKCVHIPYMTCMYIVDVVLNAKLYNYKFYYFKNERSLLLYIAKVMHAAAASIEIVLETANVVMDKDSKLLPADGEGAAEFEGAEGAHADKPSTGPTSLEQQYFAIFFTLF